MPVDSNIMHQYSFFYLKQQSQEPAADMEGVDQEHHLQNVCPQTT